jgi:hypothetical protein
MIMSALQNDPPEDDGGKPEEYDSGKFYAVETLVNTYYGPRLVISRKTRTPGLADGIMTTFEEIKKPATPIVSERIRNFQGKNHAYIEGLDFCNG